MPRAPQGRACDSSALHCISISGAIGRGRHLVEADEGEDRPQVPKVHSHIAARRRLHSLPSRRCRERRCTGLLRRHCRRTADVRATGAVRREEVFLGERCAGAVVPSLPHVAALMRESAVRCARRYACCTRMLREAHGKASVASVRCVRDLRLYHAADAHSAVLEQPRRMRLGRERGRTVLVTSRRCRLGRTGKGPAADDDHPAGHGADASAHANASRIAQHTVTRNRAERPFAVVAAGPLQHERPGARPATTRRPGVRPATTRRPGVTPVGQRCRSAPRSLSINVSPGCTTVSMYCNSTASKSVALSIATRMHREKTTRS